jgi:hypothetical protein
LGKKLSNFKTKVLAVNTIPLDASYKHGGTPSSCPFLHFVFIPAVHCPALLVLAMAPSGDSSNASIRAAPVDVGVGEIIPMVGAEVLDVPPASTMSFEFECGNHII